MKRQGLLLAMLLVTAQQGLAKDSYKYNWTIDKTRICPGDMIGSHGDFLEKGDVIETWRWWFLRSAKVQRSGRSDWKLKIRNSDRKDIFATVELPAHGGAPGKEEHCVAIEYAGFDGGSGRHFVDLFIVSMNAGDQCDAQFLDEQTKTTLRSGVCPQSHNGSARGFFP